MLSRLVRCGILSATLVVPLRGQAFLWEFDGDPVSNVEFGYRVICVGDIDNDGCDDFVVADPYVRSTGLGRTGSFYVYSGESQSLLWSVTGTETGAYMGEWLARLSDIDGDGYDDFAVTSETNHVDVYSSKLGSVIYSIPTGWSWYGPVANAGDIDQDGVADILIGNVGRHSYLYSGKFGTNLYDWPHSGGQSVSSAGDLNGDGYGDVLIGDPNVSAGTGFYNGCVFVYSGKDGSLLLEIDGKGDGRSFGASVRGGVDLDGDGVPDYLVGTNSGFADFVYAHSGATGAEITKWPTSSGDSRDRVAEFANDLDGDGVADVFINDGSDISLVSGRTFLELYRLPGRAGCMSTGDVNGDGRLDVLIGNEFDSLTGAVVAYAASIPPRVTSVQPDRFKYGAPVDVTVIGSMFSVGSSFQVYFGSGAATNVVVVDDSTLTCTAPAGDPGPVTIMVQDEIGTGSLDGGFTYTPAVTWDGSATPGGSVSLHFLCEPLDGMLAIYGADPANIPTPPFDGALGIVPFQVAFMFPQKVWPFDHFDLSGNIPNDPSLIGVTLLIQALDGPSFAKPKEATWTNVATLTITP